MKILKREKIAPINIVPGDSIRLTYKEPYKEEQCVAYHTVTDAMAVDEAIIFEFEDGDVEGWEKGLGGAFGVSN